MKYETVIFDVDGVLLNSLTPHLKICSDQNRRMGLGLTIPNEDGFRTLVRSGIKISPMESFFKAVGFPEDKALEANDYYKLNFAKEYPVEPYFGSFSATYRLWGTGAPLGIVTSNYRANIEKSLGPMMNVFRGDLVFTHDTMDGKTKAHVLAEIADYLEVNRHDCAYVGDQPNDYKCAKEAGFDFLGVTYGWGISAEDTDFPTFNSIKALAEHLCPSV